MDRPPKEIFSRLGTGLMRVLDDLLDTGQLVRLANSCDIKYPGMRTQTQRRDRLLSDLVDRAEKHQTARKVILRVLRKETAQAARDWSGLAPEERARRLSDEAFLEQDGNRGRQMFLLASSTEGPEVESLDTLLANGQSSRVAPDTDGSGAVDDARLGARLRRQIQERDKKLRHLEGQVAKTRETLKTIKRDLIQRKGDLAESRMLAERLRRDLASAQSAVQASSTRPASPEVEGVLSDVTKTLRQLAAQQKKLAHRVEQIDRPEGTRSARADGSSLPALAQSLDHLRTALEAGTRESHAELSALSKRLEELRAEVRARPSGPVGQAKPPDRPRPKGRRDRVGVFIDVQNMYYSARQLKGKLDFDALLQAAVQDRRLIKATAYVIESKETDQSQFIAMLQQRAIEVQRKALRVRADGSMKGDWDMELALDILDAAARLDVVVLVSGDGDFTSLVQRVKNIGPRVEVIAFPRTTAKSLVEAADHYQPLDRKFMIYQKNAPPSSKKARGTSRFPATPEPADGPENDGTAGDGEANDKPPAGGQRDKAKAQTG